jgi:predicted ATPase
MSPEAEHLRISSAIIEHFSLKLAHGYKDIEFSAKNSVKILVAENGAGKTTLLNALYAILTGDYRAFLACDFEELSLIISGRAWQKKRADFTSLTEAGYKDFLNADFWKRYELPLPTKSEVEEIISAVLSADDGALESTRYLSREFVTHRFPASYIKTHLQDLVAAESHAGARRKREAFQKFSAEVQEALNGVSVLYLPTYRRIEASLPEYRAKMGGVKRPPSYKRVQRVDQLIHFGLHDVETRLAEMAEEIRRSTVRAFSQINGRTLDDLLSGSYKKNIQGSKPIDPESLQVVLGRLGRNDDRTRESIERLIVTGDINHEENNYLKSFLDQLMQTYASTQDKEGAIEKFIDVINSYWSADEAEKSFVFDKASAEAKVVNTYTGGRLPLEALSSGEKQIISVFARLYLEPDRKVIVLIDEPELSLSMEWQRKFLIDFVRAESLCQLIAITHSPFIFKNELRAYAGDLQVKRHKLASDVV